MKGGNKMLKIALLNNKGEKLEDINLNKEIFGIEPNKTVVYDAVVLAQASLRQGTAKTKIRSEVSGGGRKPWKQKKTGNARQGSIRSPQWKGGGIVFGPTPRSYDKKQNKKERRLAVKSALAYKLINEEIIVLDNLNIETPKTKEIISLLKTLKVEKSALIVINELSDNLILAVSNLSNLKLVLPNEVNTYDLVAYDNLIITKDALNSLEEALK